MHSISEPILKTDHTAKTKGTTKYTADLTFDGMLYAKTVRSTQVRAKIQKIELPTLPEDYTILNYKDIPGKNILKVIFDDQPILAEDTVNYIGEPILLVVGPDKQVVKDLMKSIRITYEPLIPIYTLSDAKNLEIPPLYNEDNVFASYSYSKGDVVSAFEKATQVVEETFETGYQEQAYIEPQGMIGFYENGKVSVLGSMQCPYYIKDALSQAFNREEVRVVQATTGGGFGGKEDYPSLLACHAALAAYKTQRPVQLLLDREEDMEVTTKRHPARLNYRTALDKEGHILAMDIDVTLDGGAYSGLSNVVLQRSLICATGVYNIPHLRIQGRALATNTVPTGAFRGFGAPQSFFAIETHMNHLALKLNQTPLAFKKAHMVKMGDSTSTNGCFRHPVLLNEMIEAIEEMSSYSEKYKTYVQPTSHQKAKGVGMSLFLHGCGFTGSGERDHIKATVKLRKTSENQVEILVANVDMGQGLQTTLNKIVAKTLDVPMEQIIYNNPDTDLVPNSGPTVASRSLMIVGKLLERAAKRLKENWRDGEEQIITEHYQHPEMIPWDEQTFQGDAYPTYSWGVNVVEVEVDTLTGQVETTGLWTVFDIGNAIDDRIIQGQIEGGLVQGLGYGYLEVMKTHQGVLKQKTMTDYIIPTAKDVVKIHNKLINNPYHEGPFGAKGAGELTLIGGAPAVVAAVENALDMSAYNIPLTAEQIMEVLSHDRDSL